MQNIWKEYLQDTKNKPNIKLFISNMDLSPFWSTHELQLLQDILHKHIRHVCLSDSLVAAV